MDETNATIEALNVLHDGKDGQNKFIHSAAEFNALPLCQRRGSHKQNFKAWF